MFKKITENVLFIILVSMFFVSCEKHEHEFSLDWAFDENYHWHNAICGHKKKSEESIHIWDDGKITKMPTNEDGEKTYTCIVCGALKKEMIQGLNSVGSYKVMDSLNFTTAIGENVTSVEFGIWPQTIKEKKVTIDESNFIERGMFRYYMGSDGEFYARLPEIFGESNVKFSDGSLARVSFWPETRWRYFKVEPIVWYFVTDNFNGKKLLFSEKILATEVYFSANSVRNIDGEKVYPSNYKESRIRAWLNGISFIDYDIKSKTQFENTEFLNKGFLQTAFTPEQQEKISFCIVENSAEQNVSKFTPDIDGDIAKNLPYESENTNDKIFLFSISEIQKPLFKIVFGTNEQFEGKMTDFLKASESGLNTCWFMRSPVGDRKVYVRIYGYGETSEYSGVRPSLCLSE